jgi:tRNA dimethylallyltransferase
VLDPTVVVRVAWYKEKATEVIREVLGRKRVPVLVGGSMLYISSIVDGLEPLPQSDASVRARLEAEYDKDDGWTLYERLEEVDPKTAASFEQQNRQYVVRALELYELTGKPASELKGTVPCPFDVLIFGLSWPREQITERIDRRTSELLAAGWIEEVEGLLDRGYTAMDPGMKSHGYREVMAWLRSEEPNREELERVIAAKTRQYAKRQMT